MDPKGDTFNLSDKNDFFIPQPIILCYTIVNTKLENIVYSKK